MRHKAEWESQVLQKERWMRPGSRSTGILSRHSVLQALKLGVTQQSSVLGRDWRLAAHRNDAVRTQVEMVDCLGPFVTRVVAAFNAIGACLYCCMSVRAPSKAVPPETNDYSRQCRGDCRMLYAHQSPPPAPRPTVRTKVRASSPRPIEHYNCLSKRIQRKPWPQRQRQRPAFSSRCRR